MKKFVLSSHYARRGFTIVELMIAVFIVGILLGIGVPSYRTLVVNNCLGSASVLLVSGLQLARSEAIKRRNDVEVVMQSDWSTGWSVVDTSGNVTLRTITLTCPAKIEASSPSLTRVVYQSTGFMKPEAVLKPVFNICDRKDTRGIRARQVEISPTGRPETTVSLPSTVTAKPSGEKRELYRDVC